MDKNFYLLNMNEENRKVFLPRPMVSFYSRKISDNLVRLKLYSLDRVIGITKCAKCGKKWCQVCMNVSELIKFNSKVTCETNKINH